MTSQVEFGSLSVDFFWEIVKGRPPVDFSFTVEGIYPFLVVALSVLAVLFIIGIVSKTLYDNQTLKLAIKERRKELDGLRKSIEDENKRLRDLRASKFQEEKRNIEPELTKAKPDDGEGRREELARLKHWRMLEKEFKKL
jgi:uncharacterized membrane protein (DUF106 family)